MRLKYTWKLIILTFLLLSLFSIDIVSAIDGQAPEPGSEEDPIVSKSYVDAGDNKLLAEYDLLKQNLTTLSTENIEIKKIIASQDELIKSLTQEMKLLKEQTYSQGAGGFQVVTLENGYIIFTGSGTEIVLRSGTAKAVKGQNGGMSDTTAAKDLVDGTTVSANHLLISSRDDNRGIRAYTQCFLLVRGLYRIEKGPVEIAFTPTPIPTPIPTPATVTKKYGTVNAASLNVREKPDLNAKILAKLVKGNVVEILGKQGDWYKLITSGKITEWSAAAYVTVK